MSQRRALLIGALVSAALLVPEAARAAEPALLGHWPLDTVAGSTTPNVAGPGLAGEGVAAEQVATGRFGQALQLSNATAARQGFDVADPGQVLAPASVSVLAWVRRGAEPDRPEVIVAKAGAGRADGGRFECESSAYALTTEGDGGLYFWLTLGTGVDASLEGVSVSPDGLWDDEWHAIAGTFDAASGTMRLAVDGKVVASQVVAGRPIAYDQFPQQTLSVGHLPGLGCEFGQFGGQVDDVRVYGGALTVAELARLHTVDPSVTAPPSLMVEPTPGTSPDVTPAPAPAPMPGLTPAPTPISAPPAPAWVFVKPLGAGSTVAGGGRTSAPAVPVREAIEDAKRKVTESLVDRPKASQVSTQKDELTKAQLAKIKANNALAEQLEKLKFGLPVQVKVPGGGAFVEVGSCVAVQRKAGKKVETTTVVLPPVLLPIEKGVAKGTIPIDAKALKAIGKPGAAEAGVCTVAAAVSQVPGLTPAQLAALKAKLAAQGKATKALDDLAAKSKAIEKSLDKAGITPGAEKKLEKQLDALDARALKEQADLSSEMQKALDDTIHRIVDFLREMQDAQTVQMRALTKV